MIQRYVLVILLIAGILCAQELNIWKNYSNMQEVNNITSVDDIIWAATSGGVFSTDLLEYDNVLTKSEGLSSQGITAIEADQFGRIWIGTDNGIINIYDRETKGLNKILDINRTENTRKAINDIYIKDNKAYVSIDFGLSIIDVESMEFIETVLKFGDLPSNSKVNGINITDKIYVSTENGLAIQKPNTQNLANPESWESTFIGIEAGQIPAGTILNSVSFNNVLFVGTNTGLFNYTSNQWSKIGSSSSSIADIDVYEDLLFILYEHSLYSYDGSSFSLIYSNNDNTFNKLDVENNSSFFIASAEGIIQFNDTDLDYYYPNGPITNNFLSVAIDNSSNVWAATGKNESAGMGFMRFDQNSWTSFNKSSDDRVITNAFHKVFTHEDMVLLCTWGNGFSIFENDSLNNFTSNNTELEGISDNHDFVVIQGVDVDNSGNIWAFNHWPYNNHNLFVQTPDNNQYSFRVPPSFSFSDKVFLDNGAIDEYNTKWFSINDNGLYYFNENGTLSDNSDDAWGQLSQTQYFNSRDITCITVDNRNEIWVGTTLGIKIIPDPSSPKSQMLTVFPLRQQSISCIAVDPLNHKWVGTSQGLFHVTSDGSALIEQYDSKNSPLPTDNIQSVAIDNNTGIVYIGTEYGLSSISTTSIQPNSDFSELFVYPNPLVLGNSSDNTVKIDGLVENSSVKILTISGKLVNEFETVGGRIDYWDGKDLDGKYVASGIYIIVAYDQEANQVKTTKLAVLKK